MTKTYFNWSTGKDSSLALYKALLSNKYNIEKLVTSINQDFNRVSMHGLRNELLVAQTNSIGIPLHTISFPANVTMDGYSKKMLSETTKLKSEGFKNAIFGDIFLEDLRTYRDNKLSEVDIKGIYPLWKQNTRELLQEFLDLGFKAITVCVNATLLGQEFVGRIIDHDFINDLPKNVDVCGENGEFHTFCFDGPIFQQPINFEIGEKVLRKHNLHENDDDNCHGTKTNNDVSFWYCDLILKD